MCMEEYMITLPIERWVYEDKVFQEIANSIDPALDDDVKFAHEFYTKMLDTFEIVGEKSVKLVNKHGQRSYDDFGHFLSMQIAILKCINTELPVRQNVIYACYHCLKCEELDLVLCAEKYYGSYNKIPEQFIVYFSGYGPDSTLTFRSEGDDWTNSGVHTVIKESKT